MGTQYLHLKTILEALLKTHGSSLNDENLRTLITETKAIVNSRSLTFETLSDVNSEMSTVRCLYHQVSFSL